VIDVTAKTLMPGLVDMHGSHRLLLLLLAVGPQKTADAATQLWHLASLPTSIPIRTDLTSYESTRQSTRPDSQSTLDRIRGGDLWAGAKARFLLHTPRLPMRTAQRFDATQAGGWGHVHQKLQATTRRRATADQG